MAETMPSISTAGKDQPMSSSAAPTMSIRTDAPVAAQPPVSPTIPAPAPPVDMEKDDSISQPAELPKKDGLNAEVAAEKRQPKPVECMSVPETPVNGSTPAGQSPRPELDLTDEAKKENKPAEANVISEVKDKIAEAWKAVEDSVPEPITDIVINGPKEIAEKTAEMAGAIQTDSDANGERKRKLEGEAAKSDTEDDAAKKAKVETAGAGLNGAEKRKPGRPKKEKKEKAPPAVGKTARKTRSQGTVDV